MLGENISRLMKINCLTQKELAERAGCGQTSISTYINNKQKPGMKTLKKLAAALGVSVKELVYGHIEDDRMTDNEIKKALKCCNDGACEYCPICDNYCIQRSRREDIDNLVKEMTEVSVTDKNVGSKMEEGAE